MKLRDMFNDKNDINEKSVIGFLAFIVMVLFAVADIVAAYLGKGFTINDLIFNSFLIIVLGVFSISGIEKVLNRKTGNKNEDPPSEN